MGNSKYKLILASQSPRRRELLSHLKIPFEIWPSKAEELSSLTKPEDYVCELAQVKAFDILNLAKEKFEKPFVIGSDTIVASAGLILEKPKDRIEAREMLRSLEGKTHEVYTGVVFATVEESRQFFVRTSVTFSNIDDYLLEEYIKTGDSLDKAGAYGIQGMALGFIEKIEGSYSNVVGFPLSHCVAELKEFLLTDNWSEKFEI